MHQLLISEESRLDILDAFNWYEEQQPGLGKEFEQHLEGGLQRIKGNPLHYQKRYKNIRVYFINIFPFGVHYLVEENSIKVWSLLYESKSSKLYIKAKKR